MASCRKCGIGVGCDCNLTDGLCKRCYGTNPQVQMQKEPCTQTMEGLLNLRERIASRNRTPTSSYYLTILNSQIAQFSTSPCKFQNIIKNIS